MYDWLYLVNPLLFPVRTGIADILLRAVREDVALFWCEVYETDAAVETVVLGVAEAVHYAYPVATSRCAHGCPRDDSNIRSPGKGRVRYHYVTGAYSMVTVILYDLLAVMPAWCIAS